MGKTNSKVDFVTILAKFKFLSVVLFVKDGKNDHRFASKLCTEKREKEGKPTSISFMFFVLQEIEFSVPS